MISFLDLFTDPIIRAPVIASMLLSFAASFMSVVIFIRKRAMLGETISHATYPGVMIGLFIASLFDLDKAYPLLILCGGILTGYLGNLLLEFMNRNFRISNDAAMTFVLASFFGIGITIASYAQVSAPGLFQKIRVYLYGQTATMTDQHIYLYLLLTVPVVLTVLFFYKELVMLLFDRSFARLANGSFAALDALLFALITFSVCLGMRSVGVILISAMLVVPALAARQYTNRLSTMFCLSGLFGLLSALLGNYLSITLTALIAKYRPEFHTSLPTGPMIIIVAGFFAIFSLLFAPKRGVVIRSIRAFLFRIRIDQENLIKALWREKKLEGNGTSLILLRLKGFVAKEGNHYILTPLGEARGSQIVRLHRLWELYLVRDHKFDATLVHKSAEEIEHILTPELERELTRHLDNPQFDPHNQPIPARGAPHG